MSKIDPLVLCIRVRKHYLPSMPFSVPFSEEVAINHLKFWLRSKLLSVRGRKQELLDRIRSSKEFDGKTLKIDVAEIEISFGTKKIEELSAYQRKLIAASHLIIDKDEVTGDIMKKALIIVTGEREVEIEREREVLRRIGKEIRETDDIPELSLDDIEILENYGFTYDMKIGYLGILNLGMGIYKKTLFSLVQEKIFGIEYKKDKNV
jgi:hypothetical protein